MAQSKKVDTVTRVTEIIRPFADELGLSIWDVRFVKEGAMWYLRIFIDKQGGISVDDCANLSRVVNKPIDEADPIEKAYILEVSSPGVERELKREKHFLTSLNKKIFFRQIRPDANGVRDFSGTLVAYENGKITAQLSDDSEMTVAVKETSFVKLDDFNIADFD